MKQILVIGAGRSTSSLIKYLLDHASKNNYMVVIADMDIEMAKARANNHSSAKAVAFSIEDKELKKQLIQAADVVVSMLPASLHIKVAKTCLEFKKHLLTASYISDDLLKLNDEVKKAGLVFMNEIGLDPGLDHMSAMHIINKLREEGHKIVLFESFCGGLVAPESDTNLWNYKFTWNPRNVVIAGQGGAAKFIQEGRYKYIPYHKLFRRTEFINVEKFGKFEVYANRDSLKYREIYNLDSVLTLYRGTIRRVGFSRAWDMFVQLGMTDDSYILDASEKLSNRDFINLFLPFHPTDSVEIKLRHQLKIDQDDIMWEKLVELDLFNPNKIIGLKNATPAKMLEAILAEKWKLEPTDKDMVVMYHKIGYQTQQDDLKQIDSKLVVLGENQTFTAMAKTVGLPIAIAAVKVLQGIITQPGVQLPITKAVYQPILDELAQNGIVFTEHAVPYEGYE
ncbi:saccharopine dehydrogenase NADP-binding domain-containing protein [Flavobacterium agricola]|uniref:Saccharopine dehydrogenase NADP-binding domain-containing protein n=1 Tax=Flavobacterium agricola TaxID=2870839 RepID=A0ABY6M0C2_9FLAO|nr:saccharopine dehydrogenase family protein [Flavobacterium agricola]UYW01272.1 saccharopine dehydrogenase NADP-binding domain-containing protein [Flavobacterium agricola]